MSTESWRAGTGVRDFADALTFCMSSCDNILMGGSAKKLLEEFDALPLAERQEVVKEILRRTAWRLTT